MSDLPGLPSPYSTWNQFTSARAAAAVPLANLPIPGLITGVSSLPNSAYYPFGVSSLADPLSPLVSSSYRALPVAAVPSRFLPGIGDVPSIGIEPPYGCGLQQPRHLLHSPNFVFSQNPSPLTFDQVYRSSGCSSVSPVSQYRNQFDQRCVNSRLLLTGGRLSEPLTRDPSKTALANTGKRELDRRYGDRDNTIKRPDKSEPSQASPARPAKIWNPFESDTSKAGEQKQDSSAKSSFSSLPHSTSSRDEHCSSEQKLAVDANGNTLNKSGADNEPKVFPKHPVPQYPVKPIPLYDNHLLALNAAGGKPVDESYHAISPLTRLSHISSKHFSEGQRPQYRPKPYQYVDLSKPVNNSQKKLDDKNQSEVIIIEDDSNSTKPDLKVTGDVNQNSEVSKNCNIQKEATSVSSVKDSKNENIAGKCFNIEATNQSTAGNVGAGLVSLTTPVSAQTADLHIDGYSTSNSHLISASGQSLEEVKVSNVDCPSVNLSYSNNNTGSSKVYRDSNYFGQQGPYPCPVPQFAIASSEPTVNSNPESNAPEEPVKADLVDTTSETRDLSLVVKIPEDLPKDTSTKQSDLKSPLCSPRTRDQRSKSAQKSPKLRKKDELSALSSQVNEIRNRRTSINKDRDATKLLSPTELTQGPEFSVPLESQTKEFIERVRESRRRKMSGSGTAVTMLKNSEDSLSASISSSQISESDSDTQMSNDNAAEKLFPESQPPNTQDVYHPPGNAENRSYLPPLNSGTMSCDTQYYKTNNAPMCQTVSDNQKPPYLCVQDQTRFNEKSDLLPQYGCYPANQSSNVLPEPGTYTSQDEESSNVSYPQPSQPIEHTLDSSVDYDDNSVMSESQGVVEPECDSQHSGSQSAESSLSKAGVMNSGQSESLNSGGSFITDSDQTLQWEFLHSKQYIDNIYCRMTGCEAVKTEEESLRESDSPKTFLDLDKTTQEKKTLQKADMSTLNSKHYGGKAYSRYQSFQRHGQGQYGNQQYDAYGNQAGNRWQSFGNQSKMTSESDTHYEQNQNHYRNNYQGGYSNMNQGQNGDNKNYNQSGFHGNEYNQNDSSYYNQNQPVKGYQGSYGNSGRYDGNNYYQNKGSGDYNSQNNMYNPNSGDQRYSGQGYGGGQGNYSQHYNQQQSNGNMMGQYPNNSNQNFTIPRNASPASTGSEFGPIEPVKKKRGRKRKAEKEAQDENKPRPNTIVTCPTNIGPLIDIDNPDVPIETYDYNNQIETIFNFSVEDDLNPIGAQFLDIEKRICQKLMPIKYGHPVNVIYSPLTYAFQTHRDFVAKFCNSERTILFLGMNPGPYGMSQNGVPFGEATSVREWLKIQGDIYKPEIEHPKKPVTGLACTRNEVSGARFWGLFQKICKIPENFFKHSFVYNFCPLAYMSESGKNITPPQLVHTELDQIVDSCDGGLVELVKLMNIRIIIAVGKFVQTRASKALHNAGVMNVKVECILHPSPINPHANKGWEQIVAKQLIEMNVMQYLNPDPDAVQRQIDEWEKIAASNIKLPPEILDQ